MNTQAQISFYVDVMLAETLLGDGLSKNAQVGGLVSGLVDKVKHYFSNNVDTDNPTHSILNMLAPGAIVSLFSTMGLGWLGWLIGLAVRVFHIDVMAILGSIWEKLKSVLQNGRKTTSEEVHNIVTSSVQDHVQPATPEEAEQAGQQADHQSQPADDMKSAAMMLRQAKLIRLAMEDFKQRTINKQAAPGGWFSAFSGKKAATGNILGRVLSLFFRVALASAGLMVAGDAINAFIGKPSALNDTIQHGHPVSEPGGGGTTPTPAGSSEPWSVSATNTPEGISSMLIQFAKDVYPGMIDGQESRVQILPAFQAILENIAWYNHGSAGGPVVFMPKMFTSKKQLVDYFMHDFQKSPGA